MCVNRPVIRPEIWNMMENGIIKTNRSQKGVAAPRGGEWEEEEAVTIAMNTENEACSLVLWREFLPPAPPLTLSPCVLPSLVHKGGTVRALFITEQSPHSNLGGVRLRKLLASAEACFH